MEEQHVMGVEKAQGILTQLKVSLISILLILKKNVFLLHGEL